MCVCVCVCVICFPPTHTPFLNLREILEDIVLAFRILNLLGLTQIGADREFSVNTHNLG